VKNLIGRKFGRLTILRLKGRLRGRRAAVFKCECGTKIHRALGRVTCGFLKSCGCLAIDAVRKAKTTHGEGGIETPEYNAWASAKSRCYRKKDASYARYGGVGITMCERWLHSYKNFLADMGRRPTPQHSLDRKKNNLGYNPKNCRWSSKKEQVRNRAVTRRITFIGKTLTLKEWSEITGITYNTIFGRLKRGWKAKRILTSLKSKIEITKPVVMP